MSKTNVIGRYPTVEDPARSWDYWTLERSRILSSDKLKIANDRAGSIALRDIDDWAAATAAIFGAGAVYLERGELGEEAQARLWAYLTRDPAVAAAIQTLIAPHLVQTIGFP